MAPGTPDLCRRIAIRYLHYPLLIPAGRLLASLLQSKSSHPLEAEVLIGPDHTKADVVAPGPGGGGADADRQAGVAGMAGRSGR